MAQQDSVVVTGVSSGIGKACAEALLKRGLRVFGSVRKEQDATALVNELGAGFHPLLFDVSDAKAISQSADEVAAKLGSTKLLGIVNNAGIAVAGPLEYLPIAEFQKQIDVNVVGVLRVAQAFLPQLRRAQGRIVNIGSNSGLLATPLIGAYCASKFALEGMNDSLRRELRPFGVQVSLVEPGPIKTPIFEKSQQYGDAVFESMPPEAHQHYGKFVSRIRSVVDDRIDKALAPEEVASAVMHGLFARRPRTRYLIGRDAKLEAFLARYLPDRLQDAILARVLQFI